MARKITATVTCSIPLPSEENPTVNSITFEFDPDNDFNEPIDLQYDSATSGGPVLLPKNPPTGL